MKKNKQNKSIRIAHQSGGNCVARAFSTMRLVLGYSKPIPNGIPQGGQETCDIVRNLDKWFPNHEIIVWCDTEWVKGNHRYRHQGEYFLFNTNLDDYIVAFEYHTRTDGAEDGNIEPGHMVVGTPVFYDGMATSIVVAVK